MEKMFDGVGAFPAPLSAFDFPQPLGRSEVKERDKRFQFPGFESVEDGAIEAKSCGIRFLVLGGWEEAAPRDREAVGIVAHARGEVEVLRKETVVIGFFCPDIGGNAVEVSDMTRRDGAKAFGSGFLFEDDALFKGCPIRGLLVFDLLVGGGGAPEEARREGHRAFVGRRCGVMDRADRAEPRGDEKEKKGADQEQRVEQPPRKTHQQAPLGSGGSGGGVCRKGRRKDMRRAATEERRRSKAEAKGLSAHRWIA